MKNLNDIEIWVEDNSALFVEGSLSNELRDEIAQSILDMADEDGLSFGEDWKDWLKGLDSKLIVDWVVRPFEEVC